MALDIRYVRKDHIPYLARASHPGEPLVHVSIETLAHVAEKIRQQRMYARPNMLVQMGADGEGLDEAVRAVVDEDRAQGYRWALGREREHIATYPRFELHIAEKSAGAADLMVRCPGGEVYALWAATPDAIARAAGDAAPFFYCPNLIAVRALDVPLLRDAVASLWRDLPRHAILEGEG
jgi:hypothetical protein